MIEKIVFVVFVGLGIVFPLKMNASPANPDPVKMKQPDGREITVRLKGDENIKWMESLDGYSLMYGKDRYVVYAVSNEKGDMAPSDVIFEEAGLKSTASSSAFLMNVKKGLRYSRSQIETFRKINDILKSSSAVPSMRATTGEAKAICALIGFPDKPFAHTVDEFSQLMNQIGYSANGAKGSVRDFYKENSYGQLELIVTVVGPYTASKEWKYYGENNGTTQHDKNVGELAREAANFAFTDLKVTPADYDNDNDGFIDTFHFLYAGYGEEAGGGADCIWAHKSGFSPEVTFGTKKLDTYSCSPELRGNSGNSVTNIGVICHELCHVFGAPDYYDTDDEAGGSFVGTGTWDLMAQGSWNNGGISPAHINMYQKIVFGWVTPTILTSERNISGMLNSAENPVAYTVQTATPGEYFVLENRQKVKFDEYVRGSGLLIYRISSQVSGNRVSNSTHPQQVYPVCASSLTAMPNSDPASYGNIDSPGCPFPGSSGNISFTDYSTPSAKSWNSNNTAKPITDIKEENGLISFSFMKSNVTVSNVKTAVNGQNVTITWNLPDGALPDGYTIYRNDQTIVVLNEGTTQSYTQYGVSAGTYTYCVAPIYGVSESPKQCATAVVSGNVISCPAVSNLSVVEKGNSISLNWESDYQNVWVSKAGTFGGYFVKYNDANYTVASRFSTEDLRYRYGLSLTKVIVAINSLTCKYTIKVWTPNANVTTPGNPVLTQSFTPQTSGIHEINLNSPIPLDDSGKDLWIGISFEQSTIDFVAAIDGGPRKVGTNYVFINNTWYQTNVQDDFNFYIEGYVEDKNIKSNVAVSSSALILAGNTDILKASAAIFEGYKVYRDGQYLKTTNTKSLLDEDVPEGNHIYCVSAVYGSCESEQTCITASATKPLNLCPPVEQLAGSVNKKTVTLTWEEPQKRGGSIGYSGNILGGSIGSSTSSLDFNIAIRFAAGDLIARNGTKLTKVRFIPNNALSAYSIRIWKGGNVLSPKQLLLDQPISKVTSGAWNEITLNTPIDLDIYEELWIGVHCVSSVNQYPAAYDKTEAVMGKGNLIYFSGKWQLATDVNADFVNNWCIAGILEPMYSLSAYGIYRNGQFLASTTDRVFEQSLVENGEYSYEVSAMYHGGKESDKQGVRVYVNYTGIDKIQGENSVNIFPNPVSKGRMLTIDLGTDNVGEAVFYNLSGQVAKRVSLHAGITQCDVNLPSGTYLIQVRLETGKVSVAKIVVK
ncbi:hypothetical protein FACS1894174_02690 [Bacteroidia bacterium]|nr:hypothetical protein FACS1894174_02690 [Bacteroidia bacterium]